jgi:hypothetical protein
MVEYACWNEFLENADYWFLHGHLVNKFNNPRDPITFDWYFEDLRKRLPRRTQYVVKDEFGSVFGRDEVLEAIAERRRIWYRKEYSWLHRKYDFIYRKTPVPYTRKRRSHRGSFYRRPKTTQEKRWGYVDTEFIRGKRHPRALPDTWEDTPRSDIRIKKSWKKYRKTQYKERKELCK